MGLLEEVAEVWKQKFGDAVDDVKGDITDKIEDIEDYFKDKYYDVKDVLDNVEGAIFDFLTGEMGKDDFTPSPTDYNNMSSTVPMPTIKTKSAVNNDTNYKTDPEFSINRANYNLNRTAGDQTYYSGSKPRNYDYNVSTIGIESTVADNMSSSMGNSDKVQFSDPVDRTSVNLGEPKPSRAKSERALKESIGTSSIKKTEDNIQELTMRTVAQDPQKLRELLKENYENIQNGLLYPLYTEKSNELQLSAAKYDYQIIPNDPRLPYVSNLEDKLVRARASLGLQVHGNNNIARTVKYYMYNRYKVPDTNLAFNKMITHTFFTRPDLNLLIYNGSSNPAPNTNVMGNSEMEMLYYKNPELFKLLTDSVRAGDTNNFNLLLSNQVSSIDFKDETLKTKDYGKSWNDHSISYGNEYDGRQGGEINVTFDELQDLSVLLLIKIWMTYIENVSTGAWSPSYNLFGTGVSNNISDSYVYTRTLDYAASIYVFKVAPDGDEVLYWTKYYGVFPTSSGASALNWEKADGLGGGGKVTITFKYSFKRDMSPISLIEFNTNARVDGDTKSEAGFNIFLNQSGRPYVGVPYIESYLTSPYMEQDKSNNFGRSKIRLKFSNKVPLSDDSLYRSSYSNKGKNNFSY